jgi:solute carrier family 25 oxoglutarate transporter 11
MPTQQEIEYWRRRKQRFTKERFVVANTVALITHTITQGFDLIKVRSFMLQEGKTFNGIGLHRGYNLMQIKREIIKQGGPKVKIWYTNYEGFLARTLAYTTSRTWAYLYFYDRLNHDPRRHARPDRTAMAGVAGGLIAGIVSNPIEVVYTRMQVDDMYKPGYKRGYTSFYDGLLKTSQEGALFKGALANGLRIAALISGATGIHDWCKENLYYFLGPHFLNRFLATLVASIVATAVAMPFDTVRTRLYTQRALPNGKMPYRNMFDVISKIVKYEANPKNHGNLQAFYAGSFAHLGRFFLITYVSQYLIDFYHFNLKKEELWEPAKYAAQPMRAFSNWEPFTLAFHKGYVNSVTYEGMDETRGLTPDRKPMRYV